MFNKVVSWLKSKQNYKAPETPKVVLEDDVGLTIKRHFEGCQKKLSNGLIAPYLCPAGVPTVGWGNTFWEDGRRVSMLDSPISQARADALGQWAWDDFRKRVAAVLPSDAPSRDVSVFTSFAYNIGMHAFITSTVLREYKAGNREKAGEALEWWNKSGGVILKGLKRRRRVEHLVFDGMEVSEAIKQAEKDFP